MPIHALNRTLTQAVVEQAAIGQTDFAAAPGTGLNIYVVRIVLTLAAAGTVTFNQGTGPTAITGVIPVAANGGFVILGDGVEPVLFTTTANSKMGLVTTGVGATAHGWISYFIDA